MQIRDMRLARIERDDHPLTLEIDFYIFHAGNFHQNRSQLAHTLIAFFAFSRDLDRFQDFVIAPFRKKWIGRIGITGSCRVHRVWLSPNLTFEASALVACRCSRFLVGSEAPMWQLPSHAAQRAAATVSPLRAQPIRA